MSDMREKILATARAIAQARGYGGLNFREIGKSVGISSASMHYHFPTKADLGQALARRYREDAAASLQALSARTPSAAAALDRYPDVFRTALANGNRMCAASLMAAEHDDLPEAVKTEVRAFAAVHVAWLAETLRSATPALSPEAARAQAWAVYAAVAGAQLLARSHASTGLYDDLIAQYRRTGMLPAEG